MSNDLEDDLVDRAVVATKAAVGLIPLAGGALAEIIGSIVPNQRIDRISQYVIALGQRIERLEEVEQAAIKARPGAVDLIEEGAYQAARALSRERLSWIVNCVSNGLADNEKELLRHKRVLQLLGDLEDFQIAVLCAFGVELGHANAIYRLRPQTPVRAEKSAASDSDLAYWEYTLRKLESTSLIMFRPKMVSYDGRNAIPAMTSGGEREGSHSITDFGRWFLDVVGACQNQSLPADSTCHQPE